MLKFAKLFISHCYKTEKIRVCYHFSIRLLRGFSIYHYNHFQQKKESRKFFFLKKNKKKKVVASAISFPKQNIIYFSGFMSLIKSQRNIVEHQHISLLNQRDIVRIYPHAFFLADPGISIICS